MSTLSLTEEEKQRYREEFVKAAMAVSKDAQKRLTVDDFESMAIIGRGAFGEVRLVRRKGSGNQRREIFGACASMPLLLILFLF